MDERNDYNSIPMQHTQTAVEWLKCELKKIPFINVIEVFERAKQMEKEQIINAWIVADNELQRTAAEGYYNEKYQPK
jgi:hypothetical protein